jgi:hypothetical protein
VQPAVKSDFNQTAGNLCKFAPARKANPR